MTVKLIGANTKTASSLEALFKTNVVVSESEEEEDLFDVTLTSRLLSVIAYTDDNITIFDNSIGAYTMCISDFFELKII